MIIALFLIGGEAKADDGKIVKLIKDETALKDNPNQKIYYGLSSKEIKGILENTPLKFDQTQDDWGDPQFMIEAAGKEIIMFTYKCKSGKCEDLRLYTYWRTGGKAPDLRLMNKWNIEQRWTKSYIDKDNDIVLEVDLDIKDGITKQALLNMIEIYSNHVYKFSQYIGAK